MSSDDDLRPSKRLKVEEDKELLLLLSNNEKDSDDDETRRRREKRRQRWKTHTLNVSNDVTPLDREPLAVSQQQQQGEDAVRIDMVIEEPVIVNGIKNEDDAGFDMFSSSVSPPKESAAATSTATAKNDDFDDEEGYYKPTIGETIVCSSSVDYKVLGIVGKGVFSTVLKAKSITSDHHQQQVVALKLIRNNETMRKAALLEMRILRKLPPHKHVVQLLFPATDKEMTEHHNHVVMGFVYMRYNLRDVLQKFGRGVGLSLTSIQLYFPQLLSALRHFQKHGVLHADVKLDNILVSEDFSTCQVCDFGSAASLVDDGAMIPTPYLVSRYYRAPEIILGAVPSYEIDLWSVGVTVAELFLGSILFKGSSNNDMLESMMQVLGPFSPKQIKQHLLSTRTLSLPVHFENLYFLKQDVDKVSGQKVSKRVSLQDYPTRPLQSLLLKAKSASDSRIRVLQFADLLRKCLALDPHKRVDLKQAMHHEFLTKESGNDKK